MLSVHQVPMYNTSTGNGLTVPTRIRMVFDAAADVASAINTYGGALYAPNQTADENGLPPFLDPRDVLIPVKSALSSFTVNDLVLEFLSRILKRFPHLLQTRAVEALYVCSRNSRPVTPSSSSDCGALVQSRSSTERNDFSSDPRALVDDAAVRIDVAMNSDDTLDCFLQDSAYPQTISFADANSPQSTFSQRSLNGVAWPGSSIAAPTIILVQWMPKPLAVPRSPQPPIASSVRPTNTTSGTFGNGRPTESLPFYTSSSGNTSNFNSGIYAQSDQQQYDRSAAPQPPLPPPALQSAPVPLGLSPHPPQQAGVVADNALVGSGLGPLRFQLYRPRNVSESPQPTVSGAPPPPRSPLYAAIPNPQSATMQLHSSPQSAELNDMLTKMRRKEKQLRDDRLTLLAQEVKRRCDLVASERVERYAVESVATEEKEKLARLLYLMDKLDFLTSASAEEEREVAMNGVSARDASVRSAEWRESLYPASTAAYTNTYGARQLRGTTRLPPEWLPAAVREGRERWKRAKGDPIALPQSPELQRAVQKCSNDTVSLSYAFASTSTKGSAGGGGGAVQVFRRTEDAVEQNEAISDLIEFYLEGRRDLLTSERKAFREMVDNMYLIVDLQRKLDAELYTHAVRHDVLDSEVLNPVTYVAAAPKPRPKKPAAATEDSRKSLYPLEVKFALERLAIKESMARKDVSEEERTAWANLAIIAKYREDRIQRLSKK